MGRNDRGATGEDHKQQQTTVEHDLLCGPELHTNDRWRQLRHGSTRIVSVRYPHFVTTRAKKNCRNIRDFSFSGDSRISDIRTLISRSLVFLRKPDSRLIRVLESGKS